MQAALIRRRGKSLAELGYIDIGLDDNYQACGTGVNTSFHSFSQNGQTLVNVMNLTTFPNLRGEK